MADLLHRVTCTRQDETEGRSTPLTALHPDPSAMGFDDVFDNRQPKARSAVTGLSGDTEKLVKHAGDILARNSTPIIAHRKLHISIGRLLDLYLHAPVIGCVLQCVAQQVLEHMSNPR